MVTSSHSAVITSPEGMIWSLESSWQRRADLGKERHREISEVMLHLRPEGEVTIKQVKMEREVCQVDGTACAKALRWKGTR